MKFFRVMPEVAGSLGSDTVYDNSKFPPTVTCLEYVFDGWLGDSLLESFPCFIVTAVAADAMTRSGFTGFTLAEVWVRKSKVFEELYPDRPLPDFKWLKLLERSDAVDFQVGADNCLVCSERALELLQKFGLDNAEIEQM